MSARRLDLPAAILGLAMTLTLGGAAEAQLSGGQWRLSPQGSGRRAVEVKQQPTVFAQPGHSIFPRQPVAFLWVPAILMSDGTVFANFGFGFEPVLLPCSGAAAFGQPTVIAGNGVVLHQPQPPTYTQPVPAQKTASQQMVQSHTSGGAVTHVTQVAQTACFGRSASGGFFAYRF